MPFSFSSSALQIVLIATAVGVGYLVGTSPGGVSPPFVPDGSTLGEVPPWPIFRVAVWLNGAFKGAARATTLPKLQIIDLATAYWRSQVLVGITQNRLVDIIMEGNSNAMTCDDVAKEGGFNASHLCRLMNAGKALGLFTIGTGDSLLLFTPTEAGLMLRHDTDNSMAPFVEMINDEALDAWRASMMGDSIKKNPISGFQSNFGTANIWDWYAEHPMEEARFGKAMESFTKASAASMIADYPFPASKGATICDIGGGIGHTLKLVMDHYPDMKGILFDRVGVADSSDLVTDSDRVISIAGSFFLVDDLQDARLKTCDVFILKHILHDWDDASSITILRAVKAAAKPGAKLIVVEHVVGTAGPDMETSKLLMDLNMMASCPPGAKERTVDEYTSLFSKAGVNTTAVKYYPLRDIIGIVEVNL